MIEKAYGKNMPIRKLFDSNSDETYLYQNTEI